MSEILLIYDKECPVCDAYCRMIRIRKDFGTLKLVNAREPGKAMDEINALGLDIDQGMVLQMDEQTYYGSDAIHTLALISSRSGFFNRITYQIFRSKHLSSLFYPVLRALRNLLLKLLGRSKINNLGLENNGQF